MAPGCSIIADPNALVRPVCDGLQTFRRKYWFQDPAVRRPAE
jgi:hypothetical protein